MPVEAANVNTAGMDTLQSDSSYSEVNHLNYILKDMTFNAVEKFEKLNNMPSNVLKVEDKQFLANQLSMHFGIKGLKVNTLI